MSFDTIANAVVANIALPGSPTTTTATALDNSTKVSTTAYVDAAALVVTNASAQRASNLSDLASASTARTNLGLGSAATATGPTGTIVGTTDTQTLTNKTVDGVTPATFAFLDATSSIQTQLNSKVAAGSLTSKSTNYTISSSTDLEGSRFVVTTAAVTITLPTAVGITGRNYKIKNISSGTTTVATTSSQTIFTSSALTTVTLQIGDALEVTSDGSNWSKF